MTPQTLISHSKTLVAAWKEALNKKTKTKNNDRKAATDDYVISSIHVSAGKRGGLTFRDFTALCT